MKFLIANDKNGLFMGDFFGLAFWSNLDVGGQTRIPAFDDELCAIQFIESWLGDNDPDHYNLIGVDCNEQSMDYMDLPKEGLYKYYKSISDQLNRDKEERDDK